MFTVKYESRAQNGLYILTATSVYKTAQATEELRRNYAHIKITMLRRGHFSNIYLKIFNNLFHMQTHTHAFKYTMCCFLP